jgi:cell division transport system ATP-binding protein
MNDAVDIAPMIRFEQVGVRYGVGPEILRDLTFAIAPYSFQFLTGPSGAGKSTLLKLIMLSLHPTRGTIEMYGSDVARMTEAQLTMVRRKTGVVFQEFRLLDHLTTFENVALPMRVQGRAEASYRAQVIELLQWVGLGDRMHVLPPVLSGGEKQRAAIARALIAKPEFLIADEPTGNVDPTLARRLLRLFVELHRLGTAIIIATHDHSLMEQFEARRLVLSDGRLSIEEQAGLEEQRP